MTRSDAQPVEPEPRWSDSTLAFELLVNIGDNVKRLLGTLRRTTTMMKKFPKRTPEEKAEYEALTRRALKRLEEMKHRDIQRDAERRRRESS
jgi:hypothetical protein